MDPSRETERAPPAGSIVIGPPSPITRSPLRVISWPCSSRPKRPSRVNASPPAVCTTKKPSFSRAKSSGLPVRSSDPVEKSRCSIHASVKAMSLGLSDAVAGFSESGRETTCSTLKPAVVMFARLFAVVSIRLRSTCCADRPTMNELSMGRRLSPRCALAALEPGWARSAFSAADARIDCNMRAGG